MVAAAAALAAAQQRSRRRRRQPPPRAVLFEHVRFNRLLVAITYRGRLLSVTDAKACCYTHSFVTSPVCRDCCSRLQTGATTAQALPCPRVVNMGAKASSRLG